MLSMMQLSLFSVLQISGDMEDLPAALGIPRFKKEPVGSGSCSALIKLLPGNQDLYVAQDTWTSYQDMLRVLKKYDFAYHVTPDGQGAVKSYKLGNSVAPDDQTAPSDLGLYCLLLGYCGFHI